MHAVPNHLSLLILGCCLAATTTALNERLYGINYSLRVGPDWTSGTAKCKTKEDARRNLEQLSNEVTDNVRVFSMTDCDTAAILLPLTKEANMGLWMGIWVGPNRTNFNEERARLIELMQDDSYSFDHVLGLHVSSEAIYRGDVDLADAVDMRTIIKSDMDSAGYSNIPVVVADIIDTLIQTPVLTTLDDAVTIFNQFPFWERTVDISTSKRYMNNRVRLVERQAGDRQIVVTETGWADAGVNEDANIADPESMAKWMEDFYCLAKSRDWQYFWFNAYDSDWRRVNEQLPDDVEGHFGIYDENEVMKPHIKSLTINCPDAPTAPAAPTVSPSAIAPVTPNIGINTPTAAPIITPPTTGPTVSPMQEEPPPTTSEPASPTTPSPVQGDLLPPTSASPTASPLFQGDGSSPAECTLNNGCSVLGLEGACCPTIDDWTLACCGQETPVDACELNAECNTLELAGACCPTIDAKYLDCCEAVPDKCQGEGACERYSAVLYKQELEAAARTSASSSGERGDMVMVFTVLWAVAFL